MDTNGDKNSDRNAASNVALRRQNIASIAGVIVMAVAVGAGVWWGLQESEQQAQVHQTAQLSVRPATKFGLNAPGGLGLKTPAASAPSGIVSNDKSMSEGEILLPQPRYARPPDVFDPLDSLATTASLSGATTTAAPVPASPASAPVAVLPAGWQGAGTALQQMWDLGAQAEWKVRPAPLSRPNWRISGVVQRGEQTQVIVQIDGEPAPKFFKIGDMLPGGAKLAWVKPNVIGVVMPKVGAMAVPVLSGQAPENKPKVVKP